MQTKNNKHTNPPEWRQPRGLETCSVTPGFSQHRARKDDGGTNPDSAAYRENLKHGTRNLQPGTCNLKHET